MITLHYNDTPEVIQLMLEKGAERALSLHGLNSILCTDKPLQTPTGGDMGGSPDGEWCEIEVDTDNPDLLKVEGLDLPEGTWYDVPLTLITGVREGRKG